MEGMEIVEAVETVNPALGPREFQLLFAMFGNPVAVDKRTQAWGWAVALLTVFFAICYIAMQLWFIRGRKDAYGDIYEYRLAAKCLIGFRNIVAVLLVISFPKLMQFPVRRLDADSMNMLRRWAFLAIAYLILFLPTNLTFVWKLSSHLWYSCFLTIFLPLKYFTMLSCALRVALIAESLRTHVRKFIETASEPRSGTLDKYNNLRDVVHNTSAPLQLHTSAILICVVAASLLRTKELLGLQQWTWLGVFVQLVWVMESVMLFLPVAMLNHDIHKAAERMDEVLSSEAADWEKGVVSSRLFLRPPLFPILGCIGLTPAKLLTGAASPLWTKAVVLLGTWLMTTD